MKFFNEVVSHRPIRALTSTDVNARIDRCERSYRSK